MSTGQGCLNNPSPTAFVELNCPSSPVSNLQECGVIEVEGCDCGDRLVHAKVTCGKGNDNFVSQHSLFKHPLPWG